MPALNLSLLGRSAVDLDGQPAPALPTQKALALLIYLAVEQESEHDRDALTGLLWPGMPSRSARHNLRQLVYFLRQAFPEVAPKRGRELRRPFLCC